MKTVLSILTLLLATSNAAGQPLGTAFTYQGQLTETGQPASGLYDLQACLFDSPSNPSPIGCAPDFGDVPVEAGVFTLALDFGAAVFVGQQRFLELRVRPGASSGAYTILTPRQLVRAVPEALRSSVASAAPWSGLSGVPPGFADGVDNIGGAGTVTSVAAGTGLSGGTITGSGTIGIANGGVGLAQINTAQVQARIGSGCSVGQYVRAVNADGSVVCGTDAAGGTGTVTSVTAGTGLSGGTITGTGTIGIANGGVGAAQINPSQVQSRITGTCPVGDYFRGINADGSVACEPVPGVPRITTVDDPPANDVGSFTSIAIGFDGLPVISYHDSTAGALKVAKCTNAACTGAATITTVDNPPINRVGTFTSIAIGLDGLPVISYQDQTASTLKVAKCSNAACTGAATITVVDNPANLVGFDTAIAVGLDGRPVISYRNETAGTLKVAKCANAACTGVATITTVDDPANLVGRDTAIAIGNDERPVISYYEFTVGTLKVAKCGNAACTGPATITTIDGLSDVVGLHSAIAIDSNGRPVISYFNITDRNLRVARCSNADCTAAVITIVDNPFNAVGLSTSIAIGVDALPVIGYYDQTAGSVKIAKCTEADCTGVATITTVDDSSSSVGVDIDIAIGLDGLPVISYWDLGAGALKVAKCGTRSCQ